jgi:hypothetical protein
MAEPSKPALVTRVRAAMAGELSTAPLEALRLAGRAAYDEWIAAERLREQQSLARHGAWATTPAVGSQMLAAWNALVLQTLGEALLDADYLANRGTVGFVPAVTYDQASAWLSAVAFWVFRAKQASADPQYDLRAEIDLPVTLPDWLPVEPFPAGHVAAMMSAAPLLGAHAAAALYALERTRVPDMSARAVRELKQLATQAAAEADYASALYYAGRNPELHDVIVSNIKDAVQAWCVVGQLASMPQLLAKFRSEYPARTKPNAAPPPGAKPRRGKPAAAIVRPAIPAGAGRAPASIGHALAPANGTNPPGKELSPLSPMLRTAIALVEAVAAAHADAGFEIVEVEAREIEVHVYEFRANAERCMALIDAYAQFLGVRARKENESNTGFTYKAMGVFDGANVDVWSIIKRDKNRRRGGGRESAST